MTRATSAVIALGLLTSAPSVRADTDVAQVLARASGVPGGLTSDQVAAAVRATSPGVAVRTAELAAAAATVDQARSAYLPRLSLTARYRRLSSIQPAPFGNIVIATDGSTGVLAPGASLTSTPLAFPVLLNETTFDAQLVVPISDDLLRIARGVAAARHTEDAARFSEDAERRIAIAEARVAYYAWARARLSAIVAADAVRQADLHLADVQQRAAADRASSADVMAVQAQRAAAVQLRVRADGLARVAEAQVRIALRIDASAGELAIGEDLAHDLALADPGSDAALLADAVANRPELRAAGATAEALVDQAQAAAYSALPRLDLIADLTSADPNLRYIPTEDTFHTTWAIGAQVTWTISDVPGELAQARGLRAQAAAARAQRAALVDVLHGEVADSAAAVRDAASAQITTANGLASAEEAYRVRRELFSEGLATSTELSDSETALTRARLDSVAARIDARVAAVRIAHAVGRDGVH
jgi:outer membrane protein TolC